MTKDAAPLGGKLIDSVYFKDNPKPVFISLKLGPFSTGKFPSFFIHTFVFIRPFKAEKDFVFGVDRLGLKFDNFSFNRPGAGQDKRRFLGFTPFGISGIGRCRLNFFHGKHKVSLGLGLCHRCLVDRKNAYRCCQQNNHKYLFHCYPLF